MEKPYWTKQSWARRLFLQRASSGLGAMALGILLNKQRSVAANEEPSERFRYPMSYWRPKAKRVIFLCMAGGPSHLETFDYRPKLKAMDGQPMPSAFTQGQPIAQLQGQTLRCLGPLVKFRKHGQSGQEISDFLPHISKMADEICIVRSLQTDQINHDPAHTVMNTGTSIPGNPSMGSWVTYGLGSESDNLPGFVVLTSEGGRNPQPISSRQWHSGFLPSRFQGVEFRSKGSAVHYVNSPDGVDRIRQRDVVDAINALNRNRNKNVTNPEIDTRISQYELAFQMQTSVPGLMDLSDETEENLRLYGVRNVDGSYAANCLLARRLAERGVRFIQLYHRGWDHHGDLVSYMNTCCGLTDRPTAALLQDLNRRGMLEDTLIVWGGEFGRTPMFQGKGKQPGRDHHIRGFSMWLAGGGVRGGLTHGSTDELGYNAIEKVVHVNDLHATMLHLLGIDHERFTYPYQGRNFRLTDVGGRVVHDILA